MTNRILKVSQLLKEELSKILLKDSDFPPNVLVTVTRVETTNNLTQAKVFISVFPEEKTEEIFFLLEKRIYQFQQSLNKKLKMRPVPQIIFKREEKTAEAGRIEEILISLKKKRKRDNI
jgi:ribosome-binding factor A